MKYRDEYRDPAAARQMIEAIGRCLTRPWALMEVCGGQTHAILRYGIDRLLPDAVTLVHGPGCPVCVTPVEYIDRAIEIALLPDVIFCTFGDMLRVPAGEGDLFRAKSQGADIRVVYSPMDALSVARDNPDRQVVFFAVGFETTAPANAMAVYQAKRQGMTNFSLLVSHVLVPPAISAILSAEDNRIDGFLAAGHVCTIMGWEAYGPISATYRVPVVVTGFEPLDILEGVYLCIRQLEAGRADVENQYGRVVRRRGNENAKAMMEQVFRVVSRRWRGMGDIPESGLGLREDYAEFDAERRFGAVVCGDGQCGPCISGAVLRGASKPTDCPAFGTRCTPEHPLGVTMVSTEGACAAYYRYRHVTETGG